MTRTVILRLGFRTTRAWAVRGKDHAVKRIDALPLAVIGRRLDDHRVAHGGRI